VKQLRDQDYKNRLPAAHTRQITQRSELKVGMWMDSVYNPMVDILPKQRIKSVLYK